MMNDHFVDQINKYVKEDDTLYFLGDFVFGKGNDYLDNAQRIRERLNVRTIHFIYGNHDRREIGELFASANDMLEVDIYKQEFFLCHYDLVSWNGSNRSVICSHGHNHGTYEEYIDSVLPNRRSIDIGIDNAYRLLGEYRPFNAKELISIVNKKCK